MNKENNIIRLPEVMRRTGLSRSTIYMYTKKNIFPQPFKLSERAVGWSEKTINEWIASKLTSSPVEKEEIKKSGALTEEEIKDLEPRTKDYTSRSESTMYLLVKPAGGKYWRMKYRYGRKQKTMALGVYPEVSLKDARIRRDEARKALKEGKDPQQLKWEAKYIKEKERENLEDVNKVVKFMARIQIETEDFIDDQVERFERWGIPKQIIINNILLEVSKRIEQCQAP